jgi:hypothetical protein
VGLLFLIPVGASANMMALALAIAGSATTTPGVENIFIGQLSKVGTDGTKLGGLRIGYVGKSRHPSSQCN